MTKSLAAILSIVALAFIAGCGGDDDDGGGGGSAGADKATTQETGTKKGKVTQVAERNTQFSPKSITVAKGTTVRWTNEDSAPHDVTKTDGPGPDFASGQGDMKQGDTYEQTFSTPGTIKYVCTIHPGMEGSVTVR